LESVVVDYFRLNITGRFIARFGAWISVINLHWLSGCLGVFSARFVGHFFSLLR